MSTPKPPDPPPAAHPPPTDDQPPQPAPPSRKRIIWILAGVAALAAVIVATVIGTVLVTKDEPAAQPSPSAASAAQTARKHTVRGNITLGLGDFLWSDGTGEGNVGPNCAGDGGFNDITTGATITVTDATGTVVAVGELGSSFPELVEDGTDADGQTVYRATSCRISFTIPGVPAGHRFYGVEVTHRGKIQVPEGELSESVELTLG